MEESHPGDVNQNKDELQVDDVQPEVRVVVSRDLTSSSPPADDQQQQQVAAVPVVPDVPVAPDGGWGWAVLFAAFFVSLIVDGICYTFGVIKPELMDTFDASSSATAWAGSLCAGCYLLVGPIAGAFSNKYGCRPVCIVGGLVAGIFFFISAFSNSLVMMLITYGIIGGIGFGLMYLPSIVMVGYYFDKKRALATGITVCGSATGIFVMAPLASYLVENYTWRGANLILGGIILNGVVMGAIFRPLVDPSKVVATKDKDKEQSYIIEQVKKDKRTRTYSIDDTNLKEETEQLNAKRLDVPLNGMALHSSRTSMDSRHKLGHSDAELGQPRSRRPSIRVDDVAKKPFDRMDALYTGSLSGIREYKQAGGNINVYINSVVSMHKVDKSTASIDKVKTSPLGAFRALLSDMFDVSLLKSPTFIVVIITGFIVYLGLYTPFVYSIAKAESLGASKTESSNILVVIGVCNVFSRITTGFVSDLPCVDSVLIYNVAAILAGVVTCLVCVFNTYELLLMYGALFGVTIAAFITLRSIVIVELLGITKLNNGFGLMCLVQGVAAIIGSPISGVMYDATGSYTLPFIASGLMLGLGGVLCLPIRRLARWEQNRQQPEVTVVGPATS